MRKFSMQKLNCAQRGTNEVHVTLSFYKPEESLETSTVITKRSNASQNFFMRLNSPYSR